MKNNSDIFLKQLAKKCFDQFGAKCSQLTIVFPNKRAGVYFSKYLSLFFKKPVWSPNVISFEELIGNRQSKLLIDDIQLSFILYNVYRQVVSQPESFESFLLWGEMIIKDFNDIDNYLVKIDHIFKVVRSQKELDESFNFLSERDHIIIQDFWKSFLPTPDKKQSDFISTWSVLEELYTKFNQYLSEHNLIYKGRMFRDFTNKDDIVPSEGVVWFAGFNAFTKAEELIVKKFLDSKRADIFWDIDEYYVNDENQESGFFFQQYIEDKYFAESIQRDLVQKIKTKSCSLEVVSAPFDLGQIKSASEILDKGLSKKGWKAEETLVVMPNESLLPTVLKELPNHLEHINVTMGWTLKNTNCYSFVLKLIELKIKYIENENPRVLVKDILDILEFTRFLNLRKKEKDNFIKETNNSKRLYWRKVELDEKLPFVSKIIFEENTLQQYINDLNHLLSSIDKSSFTSLEESSAREIFVTLNRLIKATIDFNLDLSFLSFHKVFKNLGDSLKIPLTGDPLNGLQVMGILETRNLSFKNVLILNMNEGSWPKSNSNTSFIPYNVRRAFELPVLENQDAMQSYLFYRLLHNAENITVFYNNLTEYNHNGELSRYIQQLNLESTLSIEKKSVKSQVQTEQIKPITIEKNEEIIHTLQQYLVINGKKGKHLSASALNTYIDCPLKFYAKYIKKIHEPQELFQDVDAVLLGNILHHAMEVLYENHSSLDSTILNSLKNEMDNALYVAFGKEQLNMSSRDDHVGRQMIAYEVIKNIMHSIVSYDEKIAPFEIVALEKEFQIPFDIETDNGKLQVALGGIIDRIDGKDDVIRIVDYKSGNDERKFNSVEEFIDGSSGSKRNKAAFQLFYYCLMYLTTNPNDSLIIEPGMYNRKELFKDNFTSMLKYNKTYVSDYRTYHEEFKEVLSSVLKEIFDPNIPFVQREDEHKCGYCHLNNVCMKGQ